MKGAKVKKGRLFFGIVLVVFLIWLSVSIFNPSDFTQAMEAEFTPTPRLPITHLKSKIVNFTCTPNNWTLTMLFQYYDSDDVEITDGAKLVTYDWETISPYLTDPSDNAQGLVQELTNALESMAKDAGDIPADATVTFGCSAN